MHVCTAARGRFSSRPLCLSTPGLDDPQGPRVCGDGRVLLAHGAGVRERVVRPHG